MSTIKKNISHSKAHYPFLFPVVILSLIFSIFPIAFSLMLSLGNYQGGYHFVGLDNYIRIFQDKMMWKSLWNVITIIIITIPVQILIGLVFAVMLNNAMLRGKEFFRTVYYLPTVTSSVAISFVFLTMFNPTGVINNILSIVGINGPDWLANEGTARFLLMFVIIWKGLGYYVTLFLAALQNVPTDMYEAADIDGAGKVIKFFKLTVPQLRPIILYSVVMATMYGLNTFEIPNILFGGKPGPNSIAITTGQYMYDMAFRRFDFGTAAAIAWVLVFICSVMAIIQFKVGSSNE